MDESTLSPANRAALDVVRSHRGRTRTYLKIAWTLVPLGIVLLALPFLAIFLLPKSWMDVLFPEVVLPGYLLVGFACFLAGIGIGLVLLMRGPGYRRTERLIAAAEKLGLRFAFQSREGTWVERVRAMPGWPSHPRGRWYSVAGMFLGERQGVPVALIEPCSLVDPSAMLQAYTPLPYPLHQRRIYVLVPIPEGKEFQEKRLDMAAGEGLRVEIQEGWLALAGPGDLAEPETAETLLKQALGLRDRAATGAGGAPESGGH